MKGKLIVIEGSDSSGKATQTEKLYDRLAGQGYKIRKVEYPNYKSSSSALVKMYLNGEFGTAPEDVNPYAASTFYAVDRFASYKAGWKDFYEDGGIVIADRYTTANMIHQAAKLDNSEEKEKFLDWIWDFEFKKMGLPVPDCVIFLDMPPKYSQKLMEERNNKITGNVEKDIHEKNINYMIKSYENSCFISEKYNWSNVCCVDGDRIKKIGEIHEEVYDIVEKIIKK